jgi:hypothetical protein
VGIQLEILEIRVVFEILTRPLLVPFIWQSIHTHNPQNICKKEFGFVNKYSFKGLATLIYQAFEIVKGAV